MKTEIEAEIDKSANMREAHEAEVKEKETEAKRKDL